MYFTSRVGGPSRLGNFAVMNKLEKKYGKACDAISVKGWPVKTVRIRAKGQRKLDFVAESRDRVAAQTSNALPFSGTITFVALSFMPSKKAFASFARAGIES